MIPHTRKATRVICRFNSTLHSRQYTKSSPPSAHKRKNTLDSPTKPITTVEALRRATQNVKVEGGIDSDLSNRQRFAQVNFDPKVMDNLDMLELGIPQAGRYVRRRWFKYDEPEVKLPYLTFSAGAQSAPSFPKPSLPEIAFVGRSNVGKSTLVNELCGSSCARVSDRPGLTHQINFYTAANDFQLVDMPGYGFAFAADERKKTWGPLIEEFVRTRGRTLKRVMVLLDARHGVKVNDSEFIEMLGQCKVRFQIVLTKCDLVRRVDLAKTFHLVSKGNDTLNWCIPRVIMVSSKSGSGMNELRKEILHTCALGQKYLGSHKKKEVIAQIKYNQELAVFKKTAHKKCVRV